MRSMMKWEQERQMKIHNDRIRRARNKEPTRFHSASRGRASSQVNILNSLLRDYGLQQHYKKLCDLGFEHNLSGLLGLSPSELGHLTSSINFLPGQKDKFQSMLKILRRISNQKRIPKGTKSSSSHKIQQKSLEDTPIKTLKDPKGITYLKKQLRKAKERIYELEHKVQDSPKVKETVFEECKQNPSLNKSVIGKSLDSWKMTSTLHNMDVEEISKCIARLLSTGTVAQPGLVPKLMQVFEEQQLTVGDERNIYNFLRNLISRLDLDKEITITALVYVKRLLAKSGQSLTNSNWKKILFIATIVAAKVWDDTSYQNTDIIKTFTMFSLRDLNEMERNFLVLIEYELFIKSAEFAETYFLVKTYAQKNDVSCNLRKLDVHTVLKLQKHPQSTEEVTKNSLLKSV